MVDVTILGIAMVINVLCVNMALVYLALAAHLQSYQIIDFLRNHILHRGKIRISNAKHFLHLVAESLRDGNSRVEPLNAVVVLGILLQIVQVVSKMATSSPFWDLYHFVPFLILIIQIYFLMIPPAYISKCWDRVFSHVLAMHALAPTPGLYCTTNFCNFFLEDELSAIILYMKNVYAGYSVVSLRIDGTKILYVTFLVVVLLGAKAQQEVDPSWFFY